MTERCADCGGLLGYDSHNYVRCATDTVAKLKAALEAKDKALVVAAAAKDGAYAERNQCVALIVRMALALGWRAGVGKHEDKPGETWEADWRTLVSIDLPTGQASWHFHDSETHLLADMPAYAAPWDGHDTPEKYRRVRAALSLKAEQLNEGRGAQLEQENTRLESLVAVLVRRTFEGLCACGVRVFVHGIDGTVESHKDRNGNPCVCGRQQWRDVCRLPLSPTSM